MLKGQVLQSQDTQWWMDQNNIAVCKTHFRAIASDQWVDKHVVFMQRGYYCSNHTSRRKGHSDVSIWKLQSRFFSEGGCPACPMSPSLVSGFCASLWRTKVCGLHLSQRFQPSQKGRVLGHRRMMWGGDLLQALVYEDLCLGCRWRDMHIERVF